MQTLERLGIEVPAEVCIVGFDDVKYAGLARVPLTTMRKPCRAIGDLAVRVMLDRVADPSLPTVTATVNSTLCARESSQ